MKKVNNYEQCGFCKLDVDDCQCGFYELDEEYQKYIQIKANEFFNFIDQIPDKEENGKNK